MDVTCLKILSSVFAEKSRPALLLTEGRLPDSTPGTSNLNRLIPKYGPYKLLYYFSLSLSVYIYIYNYLCIYVPVPVAAPSKALVCGRSLDGIAGSITAGNIDVYLF